MKIKNIINRTRYYFKKYGFIKTIKKIISKLYAKIFKGEQLKNLQSEREKYQIWINNNEPNEQGLEEQRNTKFKIEPKFSIVVPMYNTPVNFFAELVDCLIDQTYTNWELCLADGSAEKNAELEPIINRDSRIKYKFINENKGISGNTNEALTLATGDYIALVDHDDLLPVFCLNLQKL